MHQRGSLSLRYLLNCMLTIHPQWINHRSNEKSAKYLVMQCAASLICVELMWCWWIHIFQTRLPSERNNQNPVKYNKTYMKLTTKCKQRAAANELKWNSLHKSGCSSCFLAEQIWSLLPYQNYTLTNQVWTYKTFKIFLTIIFTWIRTVPAVVAAVKRHLHCSFIIQSEQ